MTRNLRCSFCGKTEHEVAKLVAGPDVHISDICVATADRLMRDAGPPAPASRWQRFVMRLRESVSGLRHRSHLAASASPLG